jgi:hypothetical protein
MDDEKQKLQVDIEKMQQEIASIEAEKLMRAAIQKRDKDSLTPISEQGFEESMDLRRQNGKLLAELVLFTREDDDAISVISSPKSSMVSELGLPNLGSRTASIISGVDSEASEVPKLDLRALGSSMATEKIDSASYTPRSVDLRLLWSPKANSAASSTSGSQTSAHIARELVERSVSSTLTPPQRESGIDLEQTDIASNLTGTTALSRENEVLERQNRELRNQLDILTRRVLPGGTSISYYEDTETSTETPNSEVRLEYVESSSADTQSDMGTGVSQTVSDIDIIPPASPRSNVSDKSMETEISMVDEPKMRATDSQKTTSTVKSIISIGSSIFGIVRNWFNW